MPEYNPNELDGFHFTLDVNNNPIPCSLHDWGRLYDTDKGRLKRRVGAENILDKHVSTVFLGINHNFTLDSGAPILFETMVFDAMGHEIYCDRYETWEQAESGHQMAMQWVQDGCKDVDICDDSK